VTRVWEAVAIQMRQHYYGHINDHCLFLPSLSLARLAQDKCHLAEAYVVEFMSLRTITQHEGIAPLQNTKYIDTKYVPGPCS